MKTEAIYAAIGGHVLALDPETGAEIWRRLLKPSAAMTVVRRGPRIVAAAAGEVWCLDAARGEVLWHNKLKGLGVGFVAIAGGSGQGAYAAAGGEDAAIMAAVVAGMDGGCADSSGGCD